MAVMMTSPAAAVDVVVAALSTSQIACMSHSPMVSRQLSSTVLHAQTALLQPARIPRTCMHRHSFYLHVRVHVHVLMHVHVHEAYTFIAYYMISWRIDVAVCNTSARLITAPIHAVVRIRCGHLNNRQFVQIAVWLCFCCTRSILMSVYVRWSMMQ